MNIVHISFVFILCLVVYTLYSYSQEGDIQTLTRNIPKRLRKLYPTRRKIVERMRDLLIYKNHYVKWHKFMAIALFCSTLITYHFLHRLDTPTVLILTCVIFLAIDLPNRWMSAHVHSSVSQESAMLYALFEKT